ncbi:MAG: hypothetical protein V8Q84_01215 [Bilophila sp.]
MWAAGSPGLPVISGPASAFITAEQGTAFSAAASYSALLGIGVTCFYCLAYAWTARRHGGRCACWRPSQPSCITGEAVRFLPHSLALACAVGAAGPPLILRLTPPTPRRSALQQAAQGMAPASADGPRRTGGLGATTASAALGGARGVAS